MSEGKQIYELIPKVMAAIGAVKKSQKNKHFNYKFRGIDDVYNALHGPLSTIGVFIVPHKVVSSTHREVETNSGNFEVETTMVVQFRVYAKDGSYFEGEAEGVGLDGSDKASTKAHSAAYKVFCFEALCIPTDEKSDSEYGGNQRTGRGKPTQQDYKPPHGTTAPQQGDLPTKAPSTVQKAKTALMKWALDKHEAAGGTNGAAWLQGVASDVLGGKVAKTMRDVQQIREAITNGEFDLVNGEYLVGKE